MAVAMGIALYCFSPADYILWPKCPFKLLTGLDCPACGIQRFIHALLHGHWAEAVRYNYFLVYAFPYALSVAFIYYLPNGELRSRLSDVLESKIAVWIYVFSFCAWFVVRNIMGV